MGEALADLGMTRSGPVATRDDSAAMQNGLAAPAGDEGKARGA
jgi:hypothetical protein